MNVSYHYANPHAGNESFLLRFERENEQDQTACALVDAGPDVDIEDLLGDGEYLTAVVLTHAHSDHYLSLASNLRDGAPIYTSEATARILETVLTEAGRHTGSIDDIEAVLDALTPLDGWESPVADLRLAPVPAGHTPGAAGFVFQFDDGDADDTRTILATGDWTRQLAAGYAGFDTALPVDVGAVFFTGATNDAYEESLTESVGTICERAYAGSSVLVSASGLTSVQYAYLLGHLTKRLEHPVPVRLVGHAAKLYDDLDYEVPNVEAVAEFADPADLLAPETITIAGPEVPTEGSSGRLFAEIRDDPSATLVQIVAGGDTPVSSAACTTYDFEVVAHPTETEVDVMVEDLDPMQVVVTHQRGRTTRRYRDKYSSFVWATDDQQEYTIYEGGEWAAPPWMTAEGMAYVHRANGSGRGSWLGDAFEGVSESDEVPLPSCEHVEGSVDLAAEGLDVPALERRLRPSSATESGAATASVTGAANGNKSMHSAETAASTAGGPRDETLASEALASITARLDAIEAQLEGTTVPARVVDAGDGVTLLRVLGEVHLEHGRRVEVTVREADEGLNADEK